MIVLEVTSMKAETKRLALMAAVAAGLAVPAFSDIYDDACWCRALGSGECMTGCYFNGYTKMIGNQIYWCGDNYYAAFCDNSCASGQINDCFDAECFGCGC